MAKVRKIDLTIIIGEDGDIRIEMPKKVKKETVEERAGRGRVRHRIRRGDQKDDPGGGGR